MLGPVELSGDHLKDASFGYAAGANGVQTNQPAVNLEFDDTGREIFKQITSAITGLRGRTTSSPSPSTASSSPPRLRTPSSPTAVQRSPETSTRRGADARQPAQERLPADQLPGAERRADLADPRRELPQHRPAHRPRRPHPRRRVLAPAVSRARPRHGRKPRRRRCAHLSAAAHRLLEIRLPPLLAGVAGIIIGIGMAAGLLHRLLRTRAGRARGAQPPLGCRSRLGPRQAHHLGVEVGEHARRGDPLHPRRGLGARIRVHPRTHRDRRHHRRLPLHPSDARGARENEVLRPGTPDVGHGPASARRQTRRLPRSAQHRPPRVGEVSRSQAPGEGARPQSRNRQRHDRRPAREGEERVRRELGRFRLRDQCRGDRRGARHDEDRHPHDVERSRRGD
ncbi:hypothetical protein IOD13_07995 [Brevibacterium casei]|nr:hypothetical protein [Brevibacterium casei]